MGCILFNSSSSHKCNHSVRSLKVSFVQEKDVVNSAMHQLVDTEKISYAIGSKGTVLY